MSSARIIPLLFFLPFVVQAGLFKCLQPGGSVSYQQIACPESARQYEIAPDVGPAGSAEGRGDYSVETQLKRMKRSKREEQRERRQRSRAAAEEQRAEEETVRTGEHTADCARYRAQVAEWKRRNRGGYSTRDDRDYKKNKLRYYEIKAQDACGE